MNIKTDRVSGLLILLFGVALYTLIIPTYVDQVDGGWVRPNTMPNAIAIVLSVCGAMLMLRPTQQSTRELSEHVKAGLYFGLLMIGLLFMRRFGFAYIAPIIALSIMLLIGERRPLWLIAGVVGMPAAIWVLVVHVLERSLP